MSRYIDADELYKTIRAKMRSCDTDTDYGRGIQQGFDFAMDEIRQQPEADVVEVKHSWWSTVSPFNYQCMNCSALSSIEFNFCPNCGADMREREESDADIH